MFGSRRTIHGFGVSDHTLGYTEDTGLHVSGRTFEWTEDMGLGGKVRTFEYKDNTGTRGLGAHAPPPSLPMLIVAWTMHLTLERVAVVP